MVAKVYQELALLLGGSVLPIKEAKKKWYEARLDGIMCHLSGKLGKIFVSLDTGSSEPERLIFNCYQVEGEKWLTFTVVVTPSLRFGAEITIDSKVDLTYETTTSLMARFVEALHSEYTKERT